jgi:hypothetical protein
MELSSTDRRREQLAAETSEPSPSPSSPAGTWASYLPLTPKARATEVPVLYCVPETGPQDELFAGAYRPKEVL